MGNRVGVAARRSPLDLGRRGRDGGGLGMKAEGTGDGQQAGDERGHPAQTRDL